MRWLLEYILERFDLRPVFEQACDIKRDVGVVLRDGRRSEARPSKVGP